MTAKYTSRGSLVFGDNAARPMGVRFRAKSSASASQTGGADTSGETPPWDDSPMDHIGGAGKESLPWNASHMGGVGVRPRASHTGGVGEDHCASRNGGYGSEPRRKRGRRTGGADAAISPMKRYMEEKKRYSLWNLAVLNSLSYATAPRSDGSQFYICVNACMQLYSKSCFVYIYIYVCIAQVVCMVPVW